MKLLLIDDSRTMRTVQKKALASLPEVEFGEAGDGLEALKVIAETPGGFDLAIVDWNMPNMDGITFVRKVRETDKKTLLVMATTEAEKDRVVMAIQAGVNNYVIKPFAPDQLLEKIKVTLAKAKAA